MMLYLLLHTPTHPRHYKHMVCSNGSPDTSVYSTAVFSLPQCRAPPPAAASSPGGRRAAGFLIPSDTTGVGTVSSLARTSPFPGIQRTSHKSELKQLVLGREGTVMELIAVLGTLQAAWRRRRSTPCAACYQTFIPALYTIVSFHSSC